MPGYLKPGHAPAVQLLYGCSLWPAECLPFTGAVFLNFAAAMIRRAGRRLEVNGLRIVIIGEMSGARYRMGAPLDVRWMRGGWSAHFEYFADGLRVRTDFVTRPARLSAARLASLWAECEGRDIPFVGTRDLADMKKTDREKDYAVIGELARRVKDPADQLLLSRSARDLMRLAREHPDLARSLEKERPVLTAVRSGREALETALDAERRALMRNHEVRLASYSEAAARWMDAWPGIQKEIAGLALLEAHAVIVRRAEDLLPFAPEGGPHD